MEKTGNMINYLFSVIYFIVIYFIVFFVKLTKIDYFLYILSIGTLYVEITKLAWYFLYVVYKCLGVAIL